MSRLGGSRGYLRLAARPAALLLAGSAFTAAGTDPSTVLREQITSNVRISEASRAAAVRKAVRGAFDSLGDSDCQRIFSDFSDASGQKLQERLDALGETGQSYLGLVLFYDGSHLRACRSSMEQGISAITAPGSRVVYICSQTFSEGKRSRPFYPEAVIIHETLHSLGLGENPPTSAEITWRVFSRCAR
jgi:hypothetical protein